MNLNDKDYRKAECTQINQSTEEAQPAINMMIDTWVHMVQAGRLPVARTNHRNKA
jgi:hypothetical protein